MKKFNLILLSLYCTFSTINADPQPFPDPYPDIYQSIEILPYKMHGWHTHEPQVNKVFAKKKDIKVVAEIGVWLGKWATRVAKRLPPTGKYYAIDHWKGSLEHHNPGTLEFSLLPTLYQQFLSNVIHCGLTDKIIPVRMNSLDAAKRFRELNIRPDLIYIDASHDYDSVYADIEVWHALLNENGVFCGDDWNLGDISKAVKDYAEEHNLKVQVEGEFWQLEATI